MTEEMFLDKYTEINEQLNKIESILKTISEKPVYIEKEIEDPKIFTYPDTGVVTTLQSGTTRIDFLNGKVTDVDGNVTDLSHSLQSDGIEWMRCLFIETDQNIIISIDGGDKCPVRAHCDFMSTHLKYRTFEIITTVATEFFFSGSTLSE